MRYHLPDTILKVLEIKKKNSDEDPNFKESSSLVKK